MKKLFIVPAMALTLAFAACGGSGNTETTTQAEETTAPATAEENVVETVPGIEDVAIANDIVIHSSDQMKFDTELLHVKAGEEVTVTLKNAGELPKESMGHNFVVLASGVDPVSFGQEAASSNAEADFIPKTALSSVIAHTKLLGPGEEDKITFTLEKGVYTFICSFPGHFGTMQGKIVAE